MDEKIDFLIWESKTNGLVFLERNWKKPSGRLPPLSFSPHSTAKIPLKQCHPVDFGKVAGFYRKGMQLFFLIPQSWKISPDERIFVTGDFKNWNIKPGKHWELLPVDINGKAYLQTTTTPARCFGVDQPSFEFKFVSSDGRWLGVPENTPNCVTNKDGVRNYIAYRKQTGHHMFRFDFGDELSPESDPTIHWTEKNVNEVSRHLIPEPHFLDLETEANLGVQINKNETLFRIFAPRAEFVKVCFFDPAQPNEQRILHLEREDHVLWSTLVKENLHKWHYWYRIGGSNHDGSTNFDEKFLVVDPWAMALASPKGPGIILDRNKMPSSPSSFVPPSWQDLVILEGHVRDFTAKLPVNNFSRLGFSDLAKWVLNSGNYFKQLGINAVELQPIHENDGPELSSYHWGYMPVNYFAPASMYGSNPNCGSQVEEFRDLVDAFHQMGIAVILDVVYNHIGEPNYLYFIDKYYFFELSEDQHLMNFSGCGNDLRCNTPIAKKMILESLVHFLRVYNVDGFRFDLAELIGKPVLLEIEGALKREKSSVILIAEPWSFRGHMANDLTETGWASWNDEYRDFLPEYVKGNGNFDAVCHFIKGSPGLTRFPAQTVNYTQSHDDYCWIDRITENHDHQGVYPTATDRRRTHIMFSMLMGSLGIPMIASGQEFMQSKDGVFNTYLRADLNALDYNRMREYPLTVDYVQKWIHFRLSIEGSALRWEHSPLEDDLWFLRSSEASSSVLVIYNAKRRRNVARLILALHPHLGEANFFIPPEINLDSFQQIADHERFLNKGINPPLLPIADCQITIPSFSCGLWVER